MRTIQNLTNAARQMAHVILDDGSRLDIKFTYLPVIQRWQLDINHPKITLYGALLCNHPNLLRQFRNTIPFGLMCWVYDGTEPILQDDFINGRLEIDVLSLSEVIHMESLIGNV